MRILIIENDPRHLETAREFANEMLQKNGHEVRIVETIPEAYKACCWGLGWDAILSDLWIPTPSTDHEFLGVGQSTNRTKEDSAWDVAGQMPAGMAFALVAIAKGTKLVAIVTDSNHHNDRATALLDPLQHEQEGAVRIRKFEYRESPKDWADAWERLNAPVRPLVEVE